MLLTLFGSGGGGPSPIGDLTATAPIASHGRTFQRPAVAGAWRWVVEIADIGAETEAAWYDVTDWYAGDRYQRGADEYMGAYRASIATVQLQIDSDLLAPWGQDTSPLFGVDVDLGAGMLMRAGMTRVVSGDVVEWEPTWTGRVETWGDASAARGQIRTHQITVIDSIADLANVPTQILAATDTWDVYFEDRVLEGAEWSWGLEMYGDFADSGMPFDDTVVAAVNRMDAGTAPLGLVWRSLRNGRLVIHPAPWDTTNTDRYVNPLLAVYPDGVKFNFSPDFTDVAYIADDEQQPFGIQRTVAGILNSFVVTMPDDIVPLVYAIDDPISKDRYGVRPYTATWILNAPPVVDEMLLARAFAESQALPLRTTLDHEGFWSAMGILDHLDPVTVVHQTNPEGGLVVTGTGTVRNIVEERTWRGEQLMSWQSTVQIDLDATETTDALLPVENLALFATESPLTGGPSSAEFTWDNPVQPFLTPTEVQYRVIGRSLIWIDRLYPGVGADGQFVFWLSAATTYTFQVRLVRRVGGVVTNFSPIRKVIFTTPAIIVPTPIPGPDDDETDADIPGPDDEDCDLEVELQENDGTGWDTVDTFTGAELTPNGDGTYRLTTPIPNSFFNVGSVYRFRSREVCGGIPGEWHVGPDFDPPDDWTEPCTIPPSVQASPYVDAIVYIPAVCAPDIIREYFSGIEAAKGDSYAGIVAGLTNPEQRALLAIGQPTWGLTPGIVAYGECPQIVGVTGDKTMGVRTLVADNESCVLFETAGMQITAAPGSGSDWVAGMSITTVDGVISLLSGDLDINTVYSLAATFDAATGDVSLSVDDVLVDSDSFGGATATVVVLPIWRVGAPPDSWVTDCALWDSVVALPPEPDVVDYADDFNRPDDNDINAGAPMVWTDNANFFIESNTLHFNGLFDSRAQISASIAYSAEWCEVDHVSSPSVAIVGLTAHDVLSVGTTNYNFRYIGAVPGHPTPNQWELYKQVAGVYTLLASQAEAAPTSPFRIRLEVDGTSVRGYHVVAGTPVLKCTGTLDGAITGKGMGIWVQRVTGDAIADNFSAGPL